MDLIKCLIKNLRISEDKTASRLIKFRKANDAEFQIPLVFSSVATSSDGFNICLAPVILPGPCENAINHVGFRYDRRASEFDFEITNKLTNELLASGTTNHFYDFVDVVNETSTTLFSKNIDNGDGTSGVVLINKTQEDLRIIVTLTATDGESSAYVEQEYEADYYNDVNENPTYTQIDDNSFEVCLAPAQLPPQCAMLINTEPLVLKNRFYDYVISPDRYVKIFYRTTNLATGESFINSINMSTDGLVQSDYYATPNSWSVTIPNEIGITYPRASEILRNIGDRFEYRYNITYDLDNWQICKPGGYTIGTFLAIETNLYASAPLTGVKVELVITTNGVENNLGTFTFDKTNLDNDITRIYTFFKSKLTDNGWTVTDETRGDGLFFPRRALKIVKQIPDDTEVLIKLPNTNGTHLRWDSSTTDWDRLVGSFWKIKCTGGDLNEADTPDLYSITFSPTIIETPYSELGPYRLEFITAEEAGEVLDPNDYDWVALNYDTPLVIETCYLNVPPPM